MKTVKVTIEIPKDLYTKIQKKHINMCSESEYYIKNGEVISETDTSDPALRDLLDDLETCRINIEAACQYQDPTGVLRDKYERANEMLDQCISIVEMRLGN